MSRDNTDAFLHAIFNFSSLLVIFRTAMLVVQRCVSRAYSSAGRKVDNLSFADGC